MRSSTGSTRSSPPQLTSRADHQHLGTGAAPARRFACASTTEHWDDFGFAFTDDTDNGDYDLGSLSPGTYRLEFFTFRIEDDEGNIVGINADEFWDDQPSLGARREHRGEREGRGADGLRRRAGGRRVPLGGREPHAAGHQRLAGGRPDPDGLARHLEPRGDDLPLPVVRGYDARRRRHADLRTTGGRRRQDDHRDGRGLGRRPRQRRRLVGSDRGCDRNIDIAAPSDAGRQAGRQPQAARRSRAPSRRAAEPV